MWPKFLPNFAESAFSTPGYGNCRAVETVENELHVFHRSHSAWKTRQKTAEFPTVSTASTAGPSHEKKRRTIARTV
jgi:hypothetical protein